MSPYGPPRHAVLVRFPVAFGVKRTSTHVGPTTTSFCHRQLMHCERFIRLLVDNDEHLAWCVSASMRWVSTADRLMQINITAPPLAEANREPLAYRRDCESSRPSIAPHPFGEMPCTMANSLHLHAITDQQTKLALGRTAPNFIPSTSEVNDLPASCWLSYPHRCCTRTYI